MTISLCCWNFGWVTRKAVGSVYSSCWSLVVIILPAMFSNLFIIRYHILVISWNTNHRPDWLDPLIWNRLQAAHKMVLAITSRKSSPLHLQIVIKTQSKSKRQQELIAAFPGAAKAEQINVCSSRQRADSLLMGCIRVQPFRYIVLCSVCISSLQQTTSRQPFNGLYGCGVCIIVLQTTF